MLVLFKDIFRLIKVLNQRNGVLYKSLLIYFAVTSLIEMFFIYQLQNSSFESEVNNFENYKFILGLLLLSNFAVVTKHVFLNKFSFNINVELSEKYIEHWFSNPTTSKWNISLLQKNSITDSQTLVVNIIKSSLVFISNIIAVVAAVSYVLIFNTSMVWIISCIGMIAGIYIYVQRMYMLKLGHIRAKSLEKRFAEVDFYTKVEIFLRLMKEPASIISSSVKNTKDYSDAVATQIIFNTIPKPVMESVIGLVLGLYLYLLEGESRTEFIQSLLPFVVLGYRILPSLVQLNKGLSELIFYRPLLSEYNDYFSQQIKVPPLNLLPVSDKDLVRCIGVNVNYGKTKVLTDFSFSLGKSEKLIVKGPSGSGKTTFTKLILRLLDPDSGLIMYNPSLLAGKVLNFAYTAQSPVVFPGTIEENLKFGVSCFDHDKAQKLMDDLNLTNDGVSLSTTLDSSANNLSGGQKQRINVIRTLLTGSALMIFDEPTSGLDEKNERLVFEAIFSANASVIVITHSESEILTDKKTVHFG